MRRKHSLLGIFTATVMGLAMMPGASIVSFAADQFEQGTDAEGYDWELWNQYGQGSASMTHPGNGCYSCEWSNIENVLFRAGKRFGFNATKTWKEYDNIAINYDVDYQPSGNSYLCCHGWMMNPTVEYYIVEDWGNWRPPGTEVQGSVEIDGVTYDLYTSMREDKPSIFNDHDTFPQYWSVRRPSQKSSKGTIRVSDHFAAWEKIGWNMDGALYEVALNVEGYQSSGKANVKKNEIIFGADPVPVPEVPDTPEIPEDGIYFQSGFEVGTDGWSGRGDAKAEQGSTAFAGEGGLTVIGRTDTWNGAATKLDSKSFVPGSSYSFSVMAMQDAAASDEFKLTLQYTDADGKEQYDTVAEGSGKKGEWVQLSNTSYTIPAGASSLLLYVETAESKNDFCIDEACAGVEGTEFTAEPAEVKPLLGDVDLNGRVELKDLITLQKYILGEKETVDAVTADLNADEAVDVFDLALLKRELLKKKN
uniref:endo-1,4-beta-xylanase n=1 Tax=uncultured microorganism TaxID=358574 RepID=D5KQI2_9ZZZZ|nr:family 11 xylanase [uncultured microorganism]